MGGESRRVWDGGKIPPSREAESTGEPAAGTPLWAGGRGLRWRLQGDFFESLQGDGRKNRLEREEGRTGGK